MKKQLKSITILFASLLMFSCASDFGLFFFPRENGEIMYHFKPVECKGKNIDFFSTDFTIYVLNSDVVADSAVYSSVALKNSASIDSMKIGVICDGEKIYFHDKNVMYKEVYKKNIPLVRISFTLDMESTEKLLRESGIVKFFVETDGFYEEFASKKIQKKFDELRMII